MTSDSVESLVWQVASETAPDAAPRLVATCRVCHGSGRVPTQAFRGPGPYIMCWDCDGTGVEPR